MSSYIKLTIILILLTLTFTILASPVEAEDATLTVKVLTVDGKPLKNAHLEIKNSTSNEVVATGKTGSDGKASFSLELYNYSIAVYYPEGHEVGSGNVNLNETKTVTISVDVISGWTIRVYDKKERDPVEGANVTITHQGNSSIRYWRLTDENGKAGFGPIPCDSNYEVVVKFRGEEYDEGAKSPKAGDVKVKLPLYRVILMILDRKNSPVEGVVVELREELDADPIASATSDLDGEAILKLVPNGNYYLTAKLKGITVYQTEGKDITVLNDDFSKEITVNAVKLNVTVMDADGEEVMKNYTLTGKLLKNGEVVAETSSTDGILHFGHTPFETYKLKIVFGNLELYSETYEVNMDTAEGSVKAMFYDVRLEVNASALANA
ncbi:MAG: carboxypeptidase regulatory-like domain-containing protein, partial [Thaumarchaeota archaeon]|nr:carboxypeptidase regulatory-like domain-containing protein [Nitrososphaerota archaeon]